MSDNKHKNPYREGCNYFKLFDFIWKAGKVTREAVVKFARQNLKLGEKAAESSVTVILSPRAESTRGDCRGNISAKGHIYYLEIHSGKDAKGVKSDKEYLLRWREKILEVKTRKNSKKVVKTVAKKAPKTKKVTKKTKKTSSTSSTSKKAPAKAPASPATAPATDAPSAPVTPEVPVTA